MYALTIDVFVMLLILFGLQIASAIVSRALVSGRARRDLRATATTRPAARRASWKKPRTKPTPATKPPTRPRTTTPRAPGPTPRHRRRGQGRVRHRRPRRGPLAQDRARGDRGARSRLILCFAYLVIPSSGSDARQEVAQHPRRAHGRLATRLKGAIVRYGTVLLGANLLLILLPVFGILGLLLLGGLFFLVLGWMRNANRQAMQEPAWRRRSSSTPRPHISIRNSTCTGGP